MTFLRQARFQIQILLVAALLLGGGGVAYGLRNLLIQLLALAILAANPARVAEFVRHGPTGLRLLVAASLALPLLQLLPLPAAMWMTLPGREAAAQSFLLAGAGQQWSPLSLDAMRTLVAFCGTLAPAAIIVIGSGLGRGERLALARTLVFCCLAAFVLGTVQLLSANTLGLLFDERTRDDVFYATFANRNSTALLFVMALSVLAGMPWPKGGAMRPVWATAAAVFAVAIVLTQSRSGMALMVLPVLLAVLRLGLRTRLKSGGGRIGIAGFAAMALGIAAIGGGAFVIGSGDSRIATSVERFASGSADRPEMWEDSLYAARFYAPIGSGMGTFDEVFQLHESLEHVSPRKAGRAHSDWLEIAIEGGVLALLIAGGWVIWVVLACMPRGSPEGIWLRLGAGAGISAIALQSLLDYPLRNQTILCFAAVLVVLLVRERGVRA